MIDSLGDTTFGWFHRLLGDLAARAPGYQLLADYYDGTQAVPYTATKAVAEAYRRLMAMSRLNLAELIVEAVRERMEPQGFRTGAVSDDTGDAIAWGIWQANSLDADCDLVHTPQLAMGAAYVIVGPTSDDLGAPVITPEDPREVICAFDPEIRRKVTAALKVFRDDTAGVDRAYLFEPGKVTRLARAVVDDTSPMRLDEQGWRLDRVQAMPFDQVPVVGFLNRPNRWYVPTGEFEAHLPLLDRVNHTILQRVEIAMLQAFRQRAVIGDLPLVDADGNDIDYGDIFAADPGALWMLPAGAALWESGVVDLGPIRQALRDDIQDLAAVTRTPMYYLTPDAANGSAEGASLQREGLVFKCRDRIRQTSESWEAVMALAFRFAGDTERARRADMEVIWRSPERFSLAEKADAYAKVRGPNDAGVPWRTAMLDLWQFSTTQVNRMASERAGDVMLAAMAAPPSTPPPAQTTVTMPMTVEPTPPEPGAG